MNALAPRASSGISTTHVAQRPSAYVAFTTSPRPPKDSSTACLTRNEGTGCFEQHLQRRCLWKHRLQLQRDGRHHRVRDNPGDYPSVGQRNDLRFMGVDAVPAGLLLQGDPNMTSGCHLHRKPPKITANTDRDGFGVSVPDAADALFKRHPADDYLPIDASICAASLFGRRRTSSMT